jgi:hypothetical protein
MGHSEGPMRDPNFPFGTELPQAEATVSLSRSMVGNAGTVTRPAPHCWFLMEVITPKRLGCLYTFWLIILGGCIILSALASEQFECYQFCGLEQQSCSIFGVNNTVSCINITSDTWRSTGPPFHDFHSKFRRLARVVIGQPGPIRGPSFVAALANQSTSVIDLGVTLDKQSFDGATFHSVSASGAFLDTWGLRARSNGRFYALELPMNFRFADDAVGLAVRLQAPATFSNLTLHRNPLSKFSDAATLTSGLSIGFVTLAPGVLVAEVIFRIAALTLNVIVGALLVRSYVGLDSAGFDVFNFDIKRFALDLGGILVFHFITCIFCDPLAIFTLFFPANPFLRYWSDHFVYALFLSVAMFLFMYFSLMMRWLVAAKSLWFRVVALVISSLFGVAYFILDALAAAQDTNTTLVLTSPEADNDAMRGIAIAGLIIMIVWCLVVVLVFLLNKHRVVWNKGRRLYYGRLRLRIMAFRVVASCIALYGVYWIAIYLPISVAYSGFVPVYGRSGFQDVLAATVMSCLNCALWIVYRYDPEDAPPRAQQLKEESDKAKICSNRALWQFYRWTNRHFSFFGTHAHSGYYFLTERSRGRFNFRHRHLTDVRSFFCFETANAMLALSNEVYYEAPAQSCRASIAAKPSKLLSCLENCCCCFQVEHKVEKVTHHNPHVSWERYPPIAPRQDSTNNLTIQVPPEGDGGAVTNPADISDVLSSTIHEERTVSVTPSTFFAPFTDEQMDAELDDEPEGYCLPRVLDVEQFGYDLTGAVDIAGVQAIIVTHVGEDARTPQELYSWGAAEETVEMHTSGFDRQTNALRQRDAAEQSVDEFHGHRITHVCVAFRGTANAANAATDVKFGRRVFNAMRDATQGNARVHAGFESCWDKLAPHVLVQIEEALESTSRFTGMPKSRIPVLFTGHSLGGALAVLAAYSFSSETQSPLAVYTFGMPKVGNGPFAKEYDRRVPETYRVLNENDKVALMAHCSRAHVGREVIVDRDGNWIIEPNAIEERFQPLQGGGFSVKNHFLYRYARAFDKIFKAHGSPIKSFLEREAVKAGCEVPNATPPPPVTPLRDNPDVVAAVASNPTSVPPSNNASPTDDREMV